MWNFTILVLIHWTCFELCEVIYVLLKKNSIIKKNNNKKTNSIRWRVAILKKEIKCKHILKTIFFINQVLPSLAEKFPSKRYRRKTYKTSTKKLLLFSCFTLIVSIYRIGKQSLYKYCLILSSVFFSVLTIKKARKENMQQAVSSVAKKRCFNVHVFLPSLYINNIEQKSLEMKSKKY